MKFLVVIGLVVVAGCGAEPGASIPAGVDLRMQQLMADDVLWFTVLRNTDQMGAAVDCTVVNASCVADQQGELQLVPMKSGGDETTALRVSLDLAAAEGDGQLIELEGIEPSKGLPYHIAVEVGRDTGGAVQRVAHGCLLNVTVNRGRNAAQTITVTETTTACDPSF